MEKQMDNEGSAAGLRNVREVFITDGRQDIFWFEEAEES